MAERFSVTVVVPCIRCATIDVERPGRRPRNQVIVSLYRADQLPALSSYFTYTVFAPSPVAMLVHVLVVAYDSPERPGGIIVAELNM